MFLKLLKIDIFKPELLNHFINPGDLILNNNKNKLSQAKRCGSQLV